MNGRCAGLPCPHPLTAAKWGKAKALPRHGREMLWLTQVWLQLCWSLCLRSNLTCISLTLGFRFLETLPGGQAMCRTDVGMLMKDTVGLLHRIMLVSCSWDKTAAGTSLWEWKTPDWGSDKEATLTTMFNLGQYFYTPPLAKNGDVKRSAHLMAASVCTCWTPCSMSWKGMQVKTSRLVLPPPSSSSLSHLSVKET